MEFLYKTKYAIKNTLRLCSLALVSQCNNNK